MRPELSDMELIEGLVEIASEQAGHERRQEPRYPLFRRATIICESQPDRRYSAFTREVSLGGIGLLHDFPLDLESIEVMVSGESKPLRVEMRWCRPCGEGWYISGGEFA